MRTNTFAVRAAVSMAVAAGSFLLVRYYNRASVPLARIALVGYTNVTITDPIDFWHGTWLHAHMIVTNEGEVSINYDSWGSEPYGWVHAKTSNGSTNLDIAPPYTGTFTVVRPHSFQSFSVCLPLETTRWQCGFSVQTSGLREQAVVARFYDRQGWQRFLPFTDWSWRLFPRKTGYEIKLSSDLFEVDSAPSARPHNPALQ